MFVRSSVRSSSVLLYLGHLSQRGNEYSKKSRENVKGRPTASVASLLFCRGLLMLRYIYKQRAASLGIRHLDTPGLLRLFFIIVINTYPPH